MLQDKFGRTITYARLAVTDRCNLRCFYCMPENGIDFLPRNEVLSYEELLRLSQILAKEGVRKIRITGGEPFVRKDMVGFLEHLTKVNGIEEVHITTNGVLTHNYLHQLKAFGIKSINLSLDTLDKGRFEQITRRDQFDEVWKTLNDTYNLSIPLKVNMVVMKGINEQDIIPMAELALDKNLAVRYIEEMPFNGLGEKHEIINHKEILARLEAHFGALTMVTSSHGSTATEYRLANGLGKLGIIAAHSRTFCGECNRIRITAQGTMKNCLYDGGGLNLKELLRNGSSDIEIKAALQQAVSGKFKDGFEAEKNRESSFFESMTTIGG